MQCMYIGISQPFFGVYLDQYPYIGLKFQYLRSGYLTFVFIIVGDYTTIYWWLSEVIMGLCIYIYTLDCMIIHLDMQLGLDVCIVVCILFRFVFMHICIYWYHYICLLAPYCFLVFDVWSLYSPQKHRLTAVHFGGSYHRVNIQKHVENPWFPT